MSDRILIQRKQAATPSFTPPTSTPLTRSSSLQPAAAPPQAVTQVQPSPQEVQAASDKHETPDLQTQLERAKRFGHHFGRISVLQPQVKHTVSSPGDLKEQQADRIAEQVMRLPAPKPLLRPPLQGKVSDRTIVQPKLTIGQPGDPYEQEADRVADQVMSMAAPASQQQIQRKEMPQAEEELQLKPLADLIAPVVQRESMPEQAEEEQLQLKALPQQATADGSFDANSSLESQLNKSKGGGNPLPDEVRDFMEPRIGASFSSVRVHINSSAVQMNKELNAQAFTHGRDIYFGAGKYNPGTNDGKRLLAHELTHVVQQTGRGQINKELRRKPLQGEEDKQVLQAKEILGHSLEANLNKQLHLQPIDEEEDKETLQAKEPPSHALEVFPAKELRLQPLDEEQEQSAQAKELPSHAPESPNKELRLQPVEEQEEAEPLQAKELPALTPEFSLNKELQQQPLETANSVIQAKALDGGFTPSPLSIQRGIGDWLSKGWNKTKDVVGAGVEKGRDLLKSGLDWVKNNIIQPLMGLASSGWNAVKNFGSQIATAFQQANPNIWDVFLPQHLVFRVASNQRKQLFAQAIQAERSQQAQAAAGIQSSGPAPIQEPSQLERLNDLAEKVESVPAAGFGIGKELLEGAVVGDFQENPTIWNTIGQVAIGFVPYAGQVADIRDIIANVKKLHEGGYKDPDAWINLVLTGIGIIPGVGDAIKAVGKGSKGVIRKALSGVLKNADNVLRPVLGKAKGMLNGARRYGKQFLGWASRQGARLRQGVTQFAQKTVDFAKAAGQRARGLVTALKARISGFVNAAMQKASAVVSQGRGLLGKAIAQFMGMAQKAFDAVQSRVSQAVNLVKAAAERGKDIALKVGRKVADTTQKATALLREFTQSAIQKGQQALQAAKQWSSQQIKKATELGRRLVTQARKRVADLVRKGIRLAKEKALAWIKQKIRGIKQRLLSFLKNRWNRLKEKLGIGKPGKAGKEGAERGAKETTDNAAKKAAELPAAIAQAKAITEANDAADTPVPALLGVLNASVKSKYSWIKRFEARPKGTPGHYSIYMIASEHEIDPDYTTDKTRSHLYDGEIEQIPQSPYKGKWNGKGVHEWQALVERCKKDGYNIVDVKQDPTTGIRRVIIERIGKDPKTGNEVRGTIKKTIYPTKLSRAEIDAAGNKALNSATKKESGTVFEPYGSKKKADGSPADGYFEASVPMSDGNMLRVQGWFKELPDATKEITSHAPRFDNSWPSIPQKQW